MSYNPVLSYLLSFRVPPLLLSAELLHLFVPPPLLTLLLLPHLALATLLLQVEQKDLVEREKQTVAISSGRAQMILWVLQNLTKIPNYPQCSAPEPLSASLSRELAAFKQASLPAAGFTSVHLNTQMSVNSPRWVGKCRGVLPHVRHSSLSFTLSATRGRAGESQTKQTQGKTARPGLS